MGQWSAKEDDVLEPFVPVRAPADEEGFVTSFSLDDESGIKAFFEEYGFVVIRDVLEASEAQKVVDEIWDDLESGGRIKRDFPNTWETFPGAGVGIPGGGLPSMKSVWELRQNPNVHRGFSTVLNTEDLLVSLDRVGFMRPTKNILLPDGTRVDRPMWRTAAQWYHWDQNPWLYLSQPRLSDQEELDRVTEKGALLWDDPYARQGLFITENNDRPRPHFEGSEKVQGLVALLDSREDSGGFVCCPGFHRHLPTWVRAHPKKTNHPFISLNHNERDVAENVQRITMRAGSLCIWSSSLPHCNYPNDSGEFRACAYLKMFPRGALPIHLDQVMEARARAVRDEMPQGFLPSQLGQRVFGLEVLPPEERLPGDQDRQPED